MAKKNPRSLNPTEEATVAPGTPQAAEVENTSATDTPAKKTPDTAPQTAAKEVCIIWK